MSTLVSRITDTSFRMITKQMGFTCWRGNDYSTIWGEKSPMMIRHICFQQINEMEWGWVWKRRFRKPISARADSRNQWALCGMCDVHVKGAAVPGWNTRFCLTCFWILLSSWEKQVHPGLWSRLLWINRIGGRGMQKGILRVWRGLGTPRLLISGRCWGPAS